MQSPWRSFDLSAPTVWPAAVVALSGVVAGWCPESVVGSDLSVIFAGIGLVAQSTAGLAAASSWKQCNPATTAGCTEESRHLVSVFVAANLTTTCPKPRTAA